MTKIAREPVWKTPDASGSRYATGRGSVTGCAEAAADHVSYDQGRIEIHGRLRADMLDPATASAAKEIEAEAVTRRIHLVEQPGAQQHPLILRHLNLEDRELHA